MTKKTNKHFLILFLLLFAVLGGAGAGFYFGSDYTRQHYNQLSQKIDVTAILDALNIIEEKYVGDIDYQKMLYGAIRGLVRGVGDDYTDYFDPQEAKLFQEDISGSFEGVGIEITMRDGQLVVVSPIEGTPAYKAGILPKDKILKIDDTLTNELTLEEAALRIRGKKGTPVKLTIYREGWKEPKEIEIIRDKIIIPWVKVEFIDDDIAHLSILQFPENVDSQFREAAQKILDKGVKKIILDLRNNPGGIFSKAIDIAGWFLERGDVVVYEKLSDGTEIPYQAKGNSKLSDAKLVILVNEGTASASEILAGALKENKKNVKLIGEKTFGKGTVQEAVNFREGLIKVTVAYWLTPHKKMIEKFGLQPDIEVKMTEEGLEANRDPQLEKAIEIIKSL
ncbi:S41 family peptidase [bacterium]|nr:S41 family peptidase [bacterium]